MVLIYIKTRPNLNTISQHYLQVWQVA